MFKFILPLLSIVSLVFVSACSTENSPESIEQNTLSAIKKRGELVWGADVIGGIPYVYEDPEKPKSYIGFEMDIANAIAEEIGVKQRLEIRAWDSLVPELQRESFDIAINGIENTEGRSKLILFSEPYFVYSQQITVRKENADIHSFDDLKGKKVATLSGTAAEDLLRAEPSISVHINPEIIYSYRDLEEGKVDAVVLDTPIAAAYGATNPLFKNVGQTFAPGNYVIAIRQEDAALKEVIDHAIKKLKSNGELKQILSKWGIMNNLQANIGIQ